MSIFIPLGKRVFCAVSCLFYEHFDAEKVKVFYFDFVCAIKRFVTFLVLIVELWWLVRVYCCFCYIDFLVMIYVPILGCYLFYP